MIFDIARHKFYEALLMLLLLTAIFFGVAIALPSTVNVAGAAATPLASLIMRFSHDHNLLAALLSATLYVCSALTVTRSTLRSAIYPSSTMAAMSLLPLLLLPVVVMGDVTVYSCVAFLVSISLGRLFRCFGPHVAPRYIFVASLSAGALPLLDVSLSVVPLVVVIVIVISRSTFRESIIACVAALLPLFAWCYVAWCCGGSFVDEVMCLWQLVISGEQFSWLGAVTIPVIVFMALLLLLLLAVVVRYARERASFSNAMRGLWASLFLLLAVVAIAFVLLPSSSFALSVVLVTIVAILLPLLFLRLGVLSSFALYLLLLVSAVVVLL